MILDEKIIMFPPPYSSSAPSTPTHPSSTGPRPTLTSLPPHILLQIIHHTFPPLSPSHPLPSYQSAQLQLYQDTKPEKQRKTLFWLATALRLVSRQLYTACMHVLRSTYLPAYQALLRPPYTSDPFPLGVPTSSSSASSTGHTLAPSSASVGSANGPPAYDSPSTPTIAAPPSPSLSPLLTLHRETPILDRFIALKVRQDVFADDTELHIDREDAFRDLFDVAQPRARLEDLVRMYGVREGVVSVPSYYGGSTPGQTARMYRSASQSSSLISLPPSPGTSAPASMPASQSTAPAPKSRRSLFSFMKASPSSSPSPTPSPSARQLQPQPPIQPLPFAALSISFSPRRIGLVLNRSRTIAEVPRLGVGRNREPLEVLARALVGELKVALGG